MQFGKLSDKSIEILINEFQTNEIIYEIPKERLTTNMCMLKINQMLRANKTSKITELLEYMPNELKTREFYEWLFNNNLIEIWKIPIDLITETIYIKALLRGGINFKFVPPKFLTDEFLEKYMIEKEKK